MKCFLILGFFLASSALACESTFDCGIGESCVNANTLQGYSGFDNAGICADSYDINRLKRKKEQNERGCCSYHGGILQSQVRFYGGMVMCSDYTYSPTCTWK